MSNISLIVEMFSTLTTSINADNAEQEIIQQKSYTLNDVQNLTTLIAIEEFYNTFISKAGQFFSQDPISPTLYFSINGNC
jgi:hypothetical protein